MCDLRTCFIADNLFWSGQSIRIPIEFSRGGSPDSTAYTVMTRHVPSPGTIAAMVPATPELAAARHVKLPSARKSMYNPADLGPLDSMRWDEKLVERLSSLIPYDADELLDFMADQSRRERLDYIKDNGERIIIPVTTAPARFTSRQVKPLRKAFDTLAGAVAKIAAAWLDTPALQTVLPLEPYEAEWLKLAVGAPGDTAKQVFHRWDFALNLSGDPAAENFKLFEVNSVDVGGIHYAGAAHHVSMCALNVVGCAERVGHARR